jgi:sugar O-acyltransferase (sialic acid O-acetyltransferase NeuD family)
MVIYIVGAGGFAREVLNIYIDLGREEEVAGFLEENCSRDGAEVNGKPLHDISLLDNVVTSKPKLICAIGTPLRKRLIENTKDKGCDYDSIVHPSVIESRWVTFGQGSIICAGNVFTSQIRVGDYSIVNLSCTIGHDVEIGKYTTISPGVNVSGRVAIGDECFIGTGASIIEKVTIGDRSYIGAGSVVVNDIPADVLALGVPAKPVRKLDLLEWKKLV